MVDYKTNEILFSIGEGLIRRLLQDKNSMFEKLLKLITTLERINNGHVTSRFIYDKNNLVLSTVNIRQGEMNN